MSADGGNRHRRKRGTTGRHVARREQRCRVAASYRVQPARYLAADWAAKLRGRPRGRGTGQWTIGKAELARRLGWHLPQVDRVLNVHHHSRLDQIWVLSVDALKSRQWLRLQNIVGALREPRGQIRGRRYALVGALGAVVRRVCGGLQGGAVRHSLCSCAGTGCVEVPLRRSGALVSVLRAGGGSNMSRAAR